MEENKQQNIIRTAFRSELTWIVFILGLLWGAVQGIVMPLQKLQIQITTVQEQLISLDDVKDTISIIQQDHARFIEQQKSQDAQITTIINRLNNLK